MRTLQHTFITAGAIVTAILFSTTTASFASVNEGKIKDGVTLTNWMVEQKNDIITLSFDVEVEEKALAANEAIRIYPVVKSDNAEKELPFILINGKRRDAYNKRERNYEPVPVYIQNTPYLKVVSNRKETQTAHYSYQFRVEPELDNSNIYINKYWHSCCDSILLASEEVLLENITLNRTQEVEPPVADLINFFTPQQEEVKRRSMAMDAFINYHVNRDNIIPDYLDNAKELQRIHEALNPLSTENDVFQLQGLSITGYASPEATWKYNIQLGQRRAQKFWEYLKAEYALQDVKNVSIKSHGEDWDNLTLFIESDDDVPNKEEVLETIGKYTNPDEREKSIKNIAGGKSYKYIFDTYYPRLRRMQILFTYVVKNFSKEEAAQFFETRPADLSQHEMFVVAAAKTGDEHYSTLETIARYYPDDNVANINAASAALCRGDLTKAWEYLEKVKNDPRAYSNLGTYYLLRNDLERSEEYFKASAETNEERAAKGLKTLEEMKRYNEAISGEAYRYKLVFDKE